MSHHWNVKGQKTKRRINCRELNWPYGGHFIYLDHVETEIESICSLTIGHATALLPPILTMCLSLKSWFLKLRSHFFGEVNSSSTFVRMEPGGMDDGMELICSFIVRNGLRDIIEDRSRGSITVTSMSTNSTPSEEPFLILRKSSDNTFTAKYNLIGNIEDLLFEFSREGGAFVCLKEPSYNICIDKAEPDELREFITYLEAFLPKDSPPHVLLEPPNPRRNLYLDCQEKYKQRMENIINMNTNLYQFSDLNISDCSLEFAGDQVPFAGAIRNMKTLTTLRLIRVELRSSTFLEIESRELKKLHLCYCKTPLPIASLFKNDLCYKDSLVELHLEGNDWTEIPKGIFEFRNLLKLLLLGNSITQLPDKFTNLPKLQVLELSGNRLTHLPPSIFQMQNLTQLLLDNNVITELPDFSTNSSKLQLLSLSHNQLRTLPSSIFECRNLSELSLNNNRINELPDMFDKLSKLRVLELSYNQLRSVPLNIFVLQNLFYLSLSDNLITELPDMFTNLSKIKLLSLSHNQLQYLPPSICSLHLRTVNAAFNPFNLEIPSSVGRELIVHSLKELTYRTILNHKLKVEEGMLPEKFLKDLSRYQQCVCGCKYVDEGQELSFSWIFGDILSEFIDIVTDYNPRIPIRGNVCTSLQSCIHDRFPNVN